MDFNKKIKKNWNKITFFQQKKSSTVNLHCNVMPYIHTIAFVYMRTYYQQLTGSWLFQQKFMRWIYIYTFLTGVVLLQYGIDVIKVCAATHFDVKCIHLKQTTEDLLRAIEMVNFDFVTWIYSLYTHIKVVRDVIHF